MRTVLLRIVLLLPIASIASGCAPRELFSAIDRNCFVADWTNHHSCVSCCCCKNGSCRKKAPQVYPMVELGNTAMADHAIK